MKKCKVEFLEPAMWELRGIIHSYGNARFIIMDLVYEIVKELENFPRSGRLVNDKELRKQGYRVMGPEYFYSKDVKMIYRFIHDRVYIYHVVDGESTDPFFSSSNIAHLNRGREALNAGEGVQHELLEVDG